MEPKTILVRAPNWIGDQVLAFPFFHFLRRAYPRSRIVSVCVPWVAAIQYRNLVDEVVELPRPARNTWGAKITALRKMGGVLREKGPWDLAITLPNSFSSAWLVYAAGAQWRRGFAADGRGIFLNDRLKWSSARHFHRAQSYLELLPPAAQPRGMPATEFWGVPPADELDPGKPGVLPGFDAAAAWPEERPEEPPEGAFWVLAPGSQAESRRWPLEAFAAFARKVYESTGMRGLVVGGPTEAPMATRLCEDRRTGLRDWTARGSVSHYWKVFRQARFTVANDSGLAHLASLCGSPVQIPWGAGDPKRTKPLGPGRVSVHLNPVDCWPCERNTCSQAPGQYLACLRGVDPESIWKEVQAWTRPT